MKEKESKFQFSTPLLLELDFKINSKYDSSDTDKDYRYKQNLTLLTSGDDLNNVDDYNVALKIEIGGDNKCSFLLKMIIGAKFKWNKSLEVERINSLLNINAPALLLSYARPIIANITQQSGLPPYNIPFMNFINED